METGQQYFTGLLKRFLSRRKLRNCFRSSNTPEKKNHRFLSLLFEFVEKNKTQISNKEVL